MGTTLVELHICLLFENVAENSITCFMYMQRFEHSWYPPPKNVVKLNYVRVRNVSTVCQF